MVWHAAQAVFQGIETVEVELVIAPLQHLDRLELVVFELVDEVLIERFDIGGNAEGAVVQMPAGAACDLGEFGWRQHAVAAPVEFARAGKGDVIHVEIEAHADGVGRDQEIDIARLVERNLRVARARSERAQYHGRAAALPADQLGDGINVAGGKCHDGRARLQPRNFLLA